MKKDLLKNNPAIGMSWEEFEKEYFTPEEIAEAMAGIGKHGIEDELNCGGCG